MISIIVGFLTGFLGTRIIIRSFKVLMFRNRLADMAYEWSMRHMDEVIEGQEVDAFEWFIKRMPGYLAMLFSKKELTLSAWFHEEAIRKLNS